MPASQACNLQPIAANFKTDLHLATLQVIRKQHQPKLLLSIRQMLPLESLLRTSTFDLHTNHVLLPTVTHAAPKHENSRQQEHAAALHCRDHRRPRPRGLSLFVLFFVLLQSPSTMSLDRLFSCIDTAEGQG